MSRPTINLRDLVVLIADPSPYLSMIAHSILRGFGTNKVLEVRNSMGVVQTLSAQKIDILLCDARLPPHGGLSLTKAIRRKVDNENRMIPILVMSNDTRETTIRQARDAGANMVIAKPMSPASLYDRLAWIALTPRQFVDAPTYFGPDRRFKIEGYPGGVGRRKGDHIVDVAKEEGPSLAQDDIDNLFSAARFGKD
ncbi:response regulator [Pseudolabrys taiwanensis]|uniref:Response regulator n=1 Tax=Pseudolabrys taiwanensis TaxID=331696 RepID=A0A345ZYG7_9HYPH|nr:response regulator [Pseudolabrys taiwanensis]AXK81964.1 response regulator [Pseudolabrys taiwanensis]